MPGFAACGAITLNHSVGGFNPVAVELAGRSGCKIVWMPTVDAENETAGRLDGGSDKLPFWAKIQRELAAEGISPPPLNALDASGKVVEPARRCLERIAKHNMILATGHLGRREIFGLVRAAREIGVKKVLVTHAEFPSQSLTGDEQKELADLGAIIEHCFTTTYTNKAPWETAFANIRTTGVSRTLISTDLGQTINPPVAEGFAMFAQRLLDAGFSVDEVRTMAVTNPDAADRRMTPAAASDLGYQARPEAQSLKPEAGALGDLNEDCSRGDRRHGRHPHEGAAEDRRRRGGVDRQPH